MRQNRIPKPKSRGKRGSEETEPRIRAKEREGASVPGLLRSTLPRSRSRVGRGKGFRVRRSENERRGGGGRGGGGEGCYRTQTSTRISHPVGSGLGRSWVWLWGAISTSGFRWRTRLPIRKTGRAHLTGVGPPLTSAWVPLLSSFLFFEHQLANLHIYKYNISPK